MDDFYRYWFHGFESSLNLIDDESRKQIFNECGKACSNSYTETVFLNAKNNSSNEEEFIEELKKSFPEIDINVIEKEKKYDIRLKYCACDLVKQGLVKSHFLCECSKYSLLHNWQAVAGKGKVEVELIQSILAGASYCHFIVTLENRLIFV